MSFMGIGGFLSAVIFPPVNSIMILTLGWRTAWVVLAITIAVVMIPLAFFFVNKPEDMGLTGEPSMVADVDFNRADEEGNVEPI